MSLISSNTAINFIAINCPDFKANSYPVEIAMSLASGRHYHAWVKPMSDKTAPKLNERIRRNIEVYGKYPDQVCNELNILAGGTNLYCDHWGFTSTWLENLFFAACVDKQFICSPIDCLLEDDEQNSWNQRKQFVLDVLKAEDYSAASQVEVMQAVVNLFYRSDDPASEYHRPAAVIQ